MATCHFLLMKMEQKTKVQSRLETNVFFTVPNRHSKTTNKHEVFLGFRQKLSLYLLVYTYSGVKN